MTGAAGVVEGCEGNRFPPLLAASIAVFSPGHKILDRTVIGSGEERPEVGDNRGCSFLVGSFYPTADDGGDGVQ